MRFNRVFCSEKKRAIDKFHAQYVWRLNVNSLDQVFL